MTVLDKLIYGHIKKSVGERLGTLVNEISGTASLSTEEKIEAKRQVLEMVEKAFGEFVVEMRQRIQRNDPPGIENGKRVHRQ